MNVWRKTTTNIPVHPGHGFKTVIRRCRAGWLWLLMIEAETVAQGVCDSQAKCRESVRNAKSRVSQPHLEPKKRT